MKKIYLVPMFLFILSFGKGYSQSQHCNYLGCAASHTGVTTDGTLADTLISAGLGCFDGFYTKQIFWQFFYVDATGPTGNFTQTFTPTSGGDPLKLEFIVFDLGTSAPGNYNCPIDSSTWPTASIVVCENTDYAGQPVGPGLNAATVPTTVGHYYAIAINFWQSGQASYTFDISTPQLGGVNLTPADCAPIILPAKLISFDAIVNNCIVNLNWTATSETNFKNYEVQYSTNGSNFQTISTVPAALQGNNSSQNYSYQHNNPQEGQIYYRLKMVDIDGKFEYSKIIALKLDCNRSSTFVYPNPVTDILNVNITNAQNNLTSAKLFDSYGKLVYSGRLISGTNTINMTNFAKGIYLLTLKNNISTQNIKIIK